MEDNYHNDSIPARRTGQDREPEAIDTSTCLLITDSKLMQLKILYSFPGNTTAEDNYHNESIPARMTGQDREPEAIDTSTCLLITDSKLMQLKMLYSFLGNTSTENNYPNQNVPLRMTGQEREPEAVNKSKRSPMPKL